MLIIETKNLAFKDTSSDKVYHAYLVKEGSEYLVNFEFGKRGTKLQSGTKTVAPVSELEARHIFDKIVKEKLAKGYHEE